MRSRRRRGSYGALLEPSERKRAELDLPVKVFYAVCPPRRKVGIGYVLPHDLSNPEGDSAACLMPFEARRHRDPGCRSFPSRSMAVSWMRAMAEDMKCS